MEAYKLYRILEKSEKTAFKKLFKSKLTGDVGKLFEIFERHKEDNIDSDDLAEQLDKKEGVINNTASKLNKYIEDFIIYNEIAHQKDDSEAKTQRELLLLNYLRKKPEGEEITGLFKIRAKRLERKFNEIKKRDAFYYINLYKLRHYLYHAMSIDRWKSDEAKPKITDILSSIDSLYTVTKLHYGAESRVRNNMLQEETSLAMLDEAYQLSKYPHIGDTATLLTNIYRLLLDAFQYADTESLTQIKDIVIESSPYIDRREMVGILSILLHHVARTVREGSSTGMYQVGYEVLRHGLEKDCFVSEATLNYRPLVNMVAYSIKVGQPDEIERILETYSKKLHPKKYQPTVALCEAYRLYGKESYFEAYNQLKEMQGLHDIFLAVHTKILQLKCIYNLSKHGSIDEEPDKFLPEVASDFKRYFKDKFKENALPYIKFINFLLELDNVNQSRTDLEDLLQEKEYEAVFDKEWLAKQIKIK